MHFLDRAFAWVLALGFGCLATTCLFRGIGVTPVDAGYLAFAIVFALVALAFLASLARDDLYN